MKSKHQNINQYFEIKRHTSPYKVSLKLNKN